MGTVALPCRAAEQGDHLAGTFASGGAAFPFTATLAGDALTFSTGGATYTLTRPPVSPAVARGTAEVDGLQLARADTGRAVVVHLPSSTSATAALDFVLPLLPYSGYQDIVNTRTGERRSVGYYYDGIVGALNDAAHDPNEWVAVHRRDEQ